MRRSQLDGTASRDVDDVSFQEEGSVRRFPRIGAQFQTRISKSTGFTIRPTPERMSVDFPYISEKESEKLDQSGLNNFSDSNAEPAASRGGFDRSLNDSKSNRGGTLLHKPAKQTGGFSKYIQPFIMSTGNRVKPIISNEAWIQHMIHLHGTETTGKRNRSSRGGVKRKRAENEEMMWNLEHILNNLKKKHHASLGAKMLGEEEATALEHLRVSFDGNIDAAQFNVLVKLSGGQASKMRKRQERERAKRKFKIPSHQTSESWRDMYQSTTLPYKRTLLGQVQEDVDLVYAMQTTSCETQVDKPDAHTNVNLVLEPDDLKGAWRSILACAKSIERQLNCESLGPGDKKPLLSTLLTFVGKAYDLPTPESCFGTHHVMIEEVSSTIISILNHVKNAQNIHAKIRDKIFNESEEGVDSDDLLKFLETEYSSLPIRLEEVDELNKFRDVVVKWELRLLQVLSVTEEELECECTTNYLSVAEEMQHEARSHGYRSKALVQLTTRINKAYDLRDRILKWKYAGLHGKVTTVRTVSGFVKEAKRIKLFSPEVREIFDYHRLAEEWIDRANIAIRSRISLDELKNLIQRGDEMSLDLSEYVDKLKTRVRIADEWLDALDEIVPFKEDKCTSSQIWRNLETSLKNGIHNGLHDLSSEGNRIPVDVVVVKLLQLALDAKNWTTKALKWIPQNVDSKKGKLCDLREHLDKVSSLRDKLPLPEAEKQKWKPVGESELAAIIVAADSWMEKYKVFLSGDNRKGDGRSCLSISNLRTIVNEGNVIYANLGNSVTKISRILLQAETWYDSHLSLLQHCGISLKANAVEDQPKVFITIQEMTAAVEAARTDVSLDLDEAMQLRNILHKSSSWNERVALIAPKRNKRHSRGSKSKFSLEDLIGLIEEASTLPIDTNESVKRLQIQLSDVEIWRSKASKALNDILLEFSGLKSHVEDVYGEAKEYSIEKISDNSDSDEEIVNDQQEVMVNPSGKNDQHAVESTLGSPEDAQCVNRGSNSAMTVFRLIRELKEETKDISVITVEGEIGELLDAVSKWCIKSFKYLNTPREVFDKRFFGAFDRFVVEGEELSTLSSSSEQYSTSSDGLSKRLFAAWGSVVNDQLVRLMILKKEREKFEVWCKRASQILSDEKKLTAEKLADLAKSSRHFPANRDLVSKVRGLSTKVSKWTEKARNVFESGERIDLQDARILVETLEKLKVQTEELTKLRAEVRAARNWSNRAGDCNVEQGSIDVFHVKQLIEEHDSLLIEMPDELEALKQATIGYCICRRPYEGFMIGCDHCEEWYHGSCIGISESKADKVEKFTCVRCLTKIIFKNSATAAVGIIRKWTCPKDLKKARQIELQKFQRKDRKEKKDIEKFSTQIDKLQRELSELKCKGKSKENETIAESNKKTQGDNALRRDLPEKKKENTAHQSDDASVNIVSGGNGQLTNGTNNGSFPMSDEVTKEQVTTNTEVTASEAHESENLNGAEKNSGLASSSTISQTDANEPRGVVLSEAEILSKVDKAKASLQLAKDRLAKITEQSQQRMLVEAEEDSNSKILRNWCLKIRSEVLAPSTKGQSESARPTGGGSMSPVMQLMVAESKDMGISHLSDVRKMIGCFQTMSWSFSAMGVLRRKPYVSEVRHLVSEASISKLPADKALKTMKFMTNRASQLQSKIQKSLFSKKAVTKPTNISFLKELQSGIRECPLHVPEDEILRTISEVGKIPERKVLESRMEELKASCCKPMKLKEDVSPHAPNPIDQWPPFGLQHSQTAIDAFGSECLAIPLAAMADLVTSRHSEGLSKFPSPLQVSIPERKTVSSIATQADEELRENNESNSDLIRRKKASTVVTDCNGTSDLIPSSLATSNKVSEELSGKSDVKTPEDNMESGNSPLNPVSRSPPLENEHTYTTPEISYDQHQPTAGSSIEALASDTPCQPTNQLKDEPATTGISSPPMTKSSCTGQSQLEGCSKLGRAVFGKYIATDNGSKVESNEKYESANTGASVPSMILSSTICHGRLEARPKDEIKSTVDKSINLGEPSNFFPNKVEDHTTTKTGSVVSSGSLKSDSTTRPSQSESHPKFESGNAETISVDKSISVIADAPGRQVSNENRTLNQSIHTERGNHTSDTRLETLSVDPAIRSADSPKTVFKSESNHQPENAVEETPASILSEAFDGSTHSQLERHPNNESETIDVSGFNGSLRTDGSSHHSQLGSNRGHNTTETINSRPNLNTTESDTESENKDCIGNLQNQLECKPKKRMKLSPPAKDDVNIP